MGSVATRRRQRLRRFSRAKGVVSALELFVLMVEAGIDLLTPSSVGTSGASLRKPRACHRELLPMPFPCILACSSFGAVLPTRGLLLLDKLVLASSRALNYMYTGKCVELVHKPLNQAQKTAVTSFQRRWLRLAQHLGADDRLCSLDLHAFQRIVDKGAGGRGVRLQADNVDSLPVCGAVDPLPYVSDDVRAAITDPDVLVPPERRGDLDTVCHFTSGERAEYVKLLCSQCRSGKVILSRSCAHAAPSFAVAKPDTARQREVWAGSAFSVAASRPPAPPFLSAPSDLNVLESSDDQPLYMSVRDGKSFFDQLAVDERLRTLFGKPGVTVRELCSVRCDGVMSPEFEPLSFEEIANFSCDIDPDQITDDVVLVPLSKCWPMGSSWASLVAQSVMTGALLRSGVSVDQFLHAQGAVPPQGRPAFSVATDDVISFERGFFDTIVPGSVCPEFASLERIWNEDGIVGKPSKSVDRSRDGTALGRDLVAGKFLLPKRERLGDMASGLHNILTHRSASPADMSHFFGVLQWMLLANRPMLSCCGAIYRFLDAADIAIKRLPTAALRDLALASCLLPGLCQDLRDEWTPFVTASDGAQVYGYGGAKASCPPATTRQLASLARVVPHAFLLSDAKCPDEVTVGGKPRHVHRIPLSFVDFQDTFSVKASALVHASKLEIGGLGISVQNLVRKSRWHRSRTFCSS